MQQRLVKYLTEDRIFGAQILCSVYFFMSAVSVSFAALDCGSCCLILFLFVCLIGVPALTRLDAFVRVCVRRIRTNTAAACEGLARTRLAGRVELPPQDPC